MSEPLNVRAGSSPERASVWNQETKFWSHVTSWRQSVTPLVLPRALAFGLYGMLVGAVHEAYTWEGIHSSGPVQFTGGALVLLLVLRTNGGYDRWWEARKLWGGIVNQSRNLATAGLTYGPADPDWRESFVRWTAAFCHAARRSLRSERDLPELLSLLKSEAAVEQLARAQHMPTYVARRLASLLHDAAQRGGMDRIAFLAADRERAQLIDHLGGCERILKTPLPVIHTIKIRRFIVLYLFLLPLAVANDLWWMTGLVTLLVAYPLFAIEQIGVELENPFSTSHLSHLPLTDICATIEQNCLGLLDPSAE